MTLLVGEIQQQRTLARARQPRETCIPTPPHDHAAHHKYGRENVNYGILTTFWDRVMGTHQVQDKDNFFFIGRTSSNQPQQPMLRVSKPKAE